MKIKAYHNVTLLKLVQYASCIGLMLGIYLIFVGQLHWLPFLIATFLISNIGQSGALHRYFTHNSFKTGPIRHWILGFLATIATQGSILHWVGMHRLHHRHSDTENDPINHETIGLWKSFFGIVDPQEFERVSIRTVADKLRDKPVIWFHNWYWPTILIYIILLALINPWLILSCYLMPIGMIRINFGFNNTINHGSCKYVGYRNFDSNDTSTNSMLVHFLTLFTGESLHNNHHYNSKDYNFGKKWFEFDPTAKFIELFFAKKQADL